jgi:hypothetical protein
LTPPACGGRRNNPFEPHIHSEVTILLSVVPNIVFQHVVAVGAHLQGYLEIIGDYEGKYEES